jgi:hypothetical protein
VVARVGERVGEQAEQQQHLDGQRAREDRGHAPHDSL